MRAAIPPEIMTTGTVELGSGVGLGVATADEDYHHGCRDGGFYALGVGLGVATIQQLEQQLQELKKVSMPSVSGWALRLSSSTG